MKTPDLRGAIVPLLTAFGLDGELDEAAIRRHVDVLVGAGVHGVYPGGTTGEGPLLSHDERERLAATVVEAVAGRLPVVVQTGAASTAEAIVLSRHAAAAGADAVAIVTPWYYRLSEVAIVEHYVRVAEAVPDTPIVLYNIPQNTGNPMSPATMAAIARRAPNVVAVKDSTGDLAQLSDIIAATEGRLRVFEGNDAMVLPALELGAAGSVSGNANVFPEVFVELYDAYWAADHEAARRAQARIQVIRRALRNGDLGLFKAILARRGVAVGGVRGPLAEPTPSEVEACLRALADGGIEVTTAGSG
ncbi:MAG: dihydrodipicolinate synthase family protein [Acidimicrobiales bacterium]|nr:dihydrodipicolinate synthase family protein [Acidimicrobiales bacterium]